MIILLIQPFSNIANATEADFIDGAFTYITSSKRATTDTRYLTVGWYIHINKTCTSPSYTGRCDPTSAAAGENFKLDGGGHQVGPDVPVGEDMVTTFQWTAEEVRDAIGAAKAEEAIREGMTVYASAIMKVVTGPRERPTVVSGPYHTLQGIVGAEVWGNPSDLRQYFDVELTWRGDPAGYPVTMILKLSNGTVVERTVIGNYPAGHEITKSFPEEIDSGGKTYEIFRSWLSPVLRPGEQKHIQDKTRGDPKVIQRNFNVYVGGTNMVAMYREKDTQEPPTGSGDCTWEIKPPNQIAAPVTSYMNPGAQGHILSDDATNGRHFDATQAIPTSDFLYANAWALNYLFQHTFGEMEGEVIYECKIDVTYQLKWKEPVPAIPGPDGTSIPQPDRDRFGNATKQYIFTLDPREYSYWQINNLEVYKIDRATMTNYALPGGNITLRPTGYTPPTLVVMDSTNVADHVKPKDTGNINFTPEIVDEGGYSPPEPPDDTALLKDIAEAQTEDPEVQNDTVSFTWEGQETTVMDGNPVTKTGPTPGSIPEPAKIGSYKHSGDRVLYEDHLLISNSLLNKADTPSTGEIFYELLPENVGGIGNKDFAITPINSVTVHTPVVNYSSVSDDEAHNQKTVPNSNRSALILERPFKVRIPTSGQHLNDSSYPGYGDRDYEKYFRNKQVRFPFDVYNGSQTQFIPKDTWIDIPVNQLEATFFLPVWVDEGNYQVYFRNIAVNAPNSLPYERDANLNLINHVAVDEVSVEVIGRLYDFHITDIADYNWEEVFRTSKKSSQSTGVSYWVGMGDIDGQSRGNTSPYTLPLLPGSHPLQGYKNVAIKTGYHFKFDLKTKGNMFGKQDQIRITPSFYFVSRDGNEQKPVEVDLYYRTNSRPFVRIGSEQDQVSRYVILNERLRNVQVEPLIDTARYKFDHYAILSSLTREQYVDQYINKITKQKIPVGSFSLLKLPEQLRTFMGPKTTYLKGNLPSSVDAQRANASIQRWYGEYSLPAAPFVVLKGDSLGKYGPIDDKSKVFLQNKYKNGYIIVNFDIESIPNGNTDEPHLQYINAPAMNETRVDKMGMNQWEMEGFQSTIQDAYGNTFNLKNGDIVFYHGNKSSRDDFSSQVTH
ncbi:hypothetical protein J2T12_000885 [Paenibacillus anaericanus]|nr:hypothetical protein [Paenibacillus anaericanus]